MIRVSIVEDNEQLRNLLGQIIKSDDRFYLSALYENAEQALETIPDTLPDVVLMDIGLPGMNGIDCVRILKAQCPSVEFMMCTVHDEDEKVFEALEAGANSYILKRTEPEKLLAAISDLNEGGSPMSSDIARKVVQRFHRQTDVKTNYGITPREEEILSLLSKGMLYREVADALFISVKTIKKHIYNIYEKMHVHSKVEAVNKYLRNQGN